MILAATLDKNHDFLKYWNIGWVSDRFYYIKDELLSISEKVRSKIFEMPASIKFRKFYNLVGHFSPQNPPKVLRIYQNP